MGRTAFSGIAFPRLASTPSWLRCIRAPSLFDGKECIVLDYSKISLVANRIRDEIRLIAPNFYLGRVIRDSKRSLRTSLLQFG
jgi:hypothetical protein